MRFEGKVVVISGGSRGIGNGLVRGFAREGATVHFTYVKKSKSLAQLQKIGDNKGWNIFSYQIESSNKEKVEQFINSLDKVDIFINNAGVANDQLLSLMNIKQWQEVINVNLNGCFYYLSAVSKKMICEHQGSIINIASISGLKGIVGQGNYSAAKAGVISLTRTLSVELASKKIRVNTIAPGYIETEMVQSVPESKKMEWIKNIPMKRFGKIEDIVHAAFFLASEESSYITGQCLIVDGGRSVQ